MSDYIYKNPVENGYERINLTKKEHETIFKRKPNRMKKEYYKRGSLYKVHYFTPWWIKAINILLYPVLVSIHGLGNIKELNEDISDLFHEKERGKFCSDSVNVKNN